MGGSHSKALDALAKVESQVDDLGNDLQQLLSQHKKHIGRTQCELRKCKLCADALAAFTMRVDDIEMHIQKLAAGDPTSQYHRSHAHRPVHERQELSFNANAILSHIQEVLDHDIYHIHLVPNPRKADLSLPVIRRQHARIEPDTAAHPGGSGQLGLQTAARAPETRERHVPAAAAPPRAQRDRPVQMPRQVDGADRCKSERVERDPVPASDMYSSSECRGQNTLDEMQELERMAAGQYLPEFARPEDSNEDSVLEEIDSGTPVSGPDSQPDTPPNVRGEEAVNDQPQWSFPDPNELQSRLSALSVGQSPVHRASNRRSLAPSRKHNVSLSMKPAPASMASAHVHSRMPSVQESMKTGKTDSTQSTYGEGQPDVSSLTDVSSERDESYSPRRQVSIDIPATTAEEGARLAAIRDAAHRNVRPSRKESVRVALARAQQAKDKVQNSTQNLEEKDEHVDDDDAANDVHQEGEQEEEDGEEADGQHYIQVVINQAGPQRQESNSSRFETLEEKLDSYVSHEGMQCPRTGRA